MLSLLAPEPQASEILPTEVLPHHVPTATHHPDECAAQADRQGGERWRCCPDHWMPAALAAEHDAIRAAAWAAVLRSGRWHA